MESFYFVFGCVIIYAFIHAIFIVSRVSKNKITGYETAVLVFNAVMYFLILLGSSN